MRQAIGGCLQLCRRPRPLAHVSLPLLLAWVCLLLLFGAVCIVQIARTPWLVCSVVMQELSLYNLAFVCCICRAEKRFCAAFLVLVCRSCWLLGWRATTCTSTLCPTRSRRSPRCGTGGGAAGAGAARPVTCIVLIVLSGLMVPFKRKAAATVHTNWACAGCVTNPSSMGPLVHSTG